MYKAALLSNPHCYAAELIGAPKHAQANLPTRARSADAAPTVPAQRARANSGEKCGLGFGPLLSPDHTQSDDGGAINHDADDHADEQPARMKTRADLLE